MKLWHGVCVWVWVSVCVIHALKVLNMCIAGLVVTRCGMLSRLVLVGRLDLVGTRTGTRLETDWKIRLELGVF